MACGRTAMADKTDADFKRMVRYFYEEKGDPTSYVGWDAERCKRLMPSFFEAWQQSRVYTNLSSLAIKQEVPDDE
jgi:hypothetical protein